MRKRSVASGTTGVRWWAGLLGLVCLSWGTAAFSQDSTGLDLSTAYDRAVSSMDTGKFDEGLAIVDKVIADYAGDALDDYGPVFGHFYFIRGMLLIRKQEYQSAIEALRICYETYDNEILKQSVQDDHRLPNRFRIQALEQWAGCEMAMGEFAAAAERYQQVLKEDDQKYEPRINRLQVQINLAKCFIQSGKVADGRAFLEKQLDSETLTEPTKRMVFMVLVNNWAPKASTPEVRDFLTRYGDLIRNEELLSRRSRNGAFAAQAGAAFKANDPLRALLWYGMMGHPGEILELYQRRIIELEARVVEEDIKAQVEARIAELKAEIPGLRKEYVSMQLGIGGAHYQLESLAGSRAAYLLLTREFPEIEQRPVVLHNLVVCSVNLNRWDEANEFATTFFREFPEHELKGSVARVWVEVLFLQEEYAEAHRVASQVREGMEPGSSDRDVPDFVAGGSLFHLGRFEEAEDELSSYIERYPEGSRIELARFYYGAGKVNLFQWQAGAEALDGFLTDFKDSAMRPSALYLSGLSHLVLEDWDITLARMEELHAVFSGAEEIPGSHNVKGDALAGKGEADFEAIAAAHLEAKRLVEEEGRGDLEVVGYALRQLISVASKAQEWEKAGAWFDEFMEKYQGTSWRTDAIVSALDALVELERKDEARSLLETLVNEVGDEPGNPQLDELFGSYVDFLRENYPVEETLQRLRNFPASPSPPPAPLRAWLAMGEIEVLSDADAEKNREAINQVYYRLAALQDGGNLSNYTMVRLARWNLEDRKKPDAAEEIYDFILLQRPQGEAVGIALVDSAKILAAKNTTNSREEALNRFERVLNEVDQAEVREEAVLGIARLHTAQENWDVARQWWEAYLDDRSFTLARPEANYQYAVCLDQKGDKAEAKKAYVNVYVIHAGHFDWSTKAYLRAAEMRREEGSLVDGLKILQDMLKRMGHLEHPGIEEGRKRFYAWRDELVAGRK